MPNEFTFMSHASYPPKECARERRREPEATGACENLLQHFLGHKDASSMETGLLALIVVIGLVIFFGLGTAFIGVAKKYPLLAIAIAAFYWWSFNKDKK